MATQNRVGSRGGPLSGHGTIAALLRNAGALVWLAVIVLFAGCSSRGVSLLPVVASDGLQGETWDDLDLYLIDPRTGESTRLTDTPEVMETDPHLNKRGTRIVYVARGVTDGEPVLNVSGIIDPNEGLPDSSSRWRPQRNVPSRLVVTTPDGLQHETIFNSERLIFSPTWSIAGDRIAFTELIDGRLHMRVINADGTGLQDLGFGSFPSWRKDDAGLFYSDMDDPEATSGVLHYRVLSTGVIEPLGLHGTGFFNFQAGLMVAYQSAAYSRRNETIWALTSTNRQLRLTDPASHEHDLDPVFFGKSGMLVFSRRTDTEHGLGVRLMSIHHQTEDRVATPIDSPGVVTYTRGGLDVARHYPR